MGTLEGKSMAQNKAKLDSVRRLPAAVVAAHSHLILFGFQDLFPTLKANWGVFIPFQAVNLSLVPPSLREPLSSFLAFVERVGPDIMTI